MHHTYAIIVTIITINKTKGKLEYIRNNKDQSDGSVIV